MAALLLAWLAASCGERFVWLVLATGSRCKSGLAADRSDSSNSSESSDSTSLLARLAFLAVASQQTSGTWPAGSICAP